MTNPKTYYRPQSLAEAIERAAHPGSIAFAGGALALSGLSIAYDTVVDLQDLTELKHIEHSDDGLHIGGINTLEEVIESPLIPVKLKEAISRTYPLNIRNNTSVGESLIIKMPSAEWLAALVAIDAILEHAGHLAGADKSPLWEQPLEEFIEFLYLHGHPYQGIITQVRIPPMGRHTLIGTSFVARTPADIPIVNAAVRVTLDRHNTINGAIAVIGGVSEAPVIALDLVNLIGKQLTSDPALATEIIEGNIHPTADYRGSVEYRREMASLCVQRAYEESLEQFKTMGH